MTEAREIAIDVDAANRVSGLLMLPDGATALYVLAHGAGAGMRHAFMEAIAGALAERGIGTLRYQFPYMEKGSRRPDRPALAQATVRAAVAAARAAAPGVTLLAGGKSFGGRMSSQAEAAEPLGVAGLVFLGFPLHPPGKPSTERGDHLAGVTVPMLFLQGTRDEFATSPLIEEVTGGLAGATLAPVEGGDHSFKVPKKLGREPAEVMADLATRISGWANALD